MTIQWIGLDEFEASLLKLAPETTVLTAEAFARIADEVLTEAQDRITSTLKNPDIDTGEVVDSGHVERSPVGAEVIFDHPAAAYVHEGVNGNEPHKKFLERPALEAEGETEAAAVEALKVAAS